MTLSRAGSSCRKCLARARVQEKYLSQIADLYEDFNVVVTPLRESEVRGVPALTAFAAFLREPCVRVAAMAVGAALASRGACWRRAQR